MCQPPEDNFPASLSDHSKVSAVSTKGGKSLFPVKQSAKSDSASAKNKNNLPSLKSKEFSCDKCGKTFDHAWCNTRHMLQSLSCSLQQTYFVCLWNGCTCKQYTSKVALNEHVSSVHTGEKLYRCNIGKCQKGFFHAAQLCEHHRICDGSEYLSE